MIRRLNNMEAAEVLRGYPEAIKAYDDNDYIICKTAVADTYYYSIHTNAGEACTGFRSRDEIVSWFLDLAIEDTSDGWEEMVDV